MVRGSAKIKRMTLEAMGATGIARIFEPVFGGRGIILMAHHVRPQTSGGTFLPNAGLEITPEFLDEVIRLLRRRGLTLLHLPEAIDWLKGSGGRRGRFAVLTIDDGYRDTVEYALPVLRAQNAPFAVFLCSGIVDGSLLQWWRALEYLVAENERLTIPADPQGVAVDLTSRGAKEAAWRRLQVVLGGMSPLRQREWIEDVCERNGIDSSRLPRVAGMGWDGARALAAEPLCRLGAHSVTHPSMRVLDSGSALREMVASRDDIAENTGVVVEDFAYPYGDRSAVSARDFRLAKDAGFRAAVTTRRGLIFDWHADHLEALPRLNLNGMNQRINYIDAAISGLPIAIANRRRVVRAG